MRLRKWKTILFIIVVAGAVPLLTADIASAWICDFMTGGGWIVYNGNKGTFGVGGGCKHGSGTNGVPYWGHLEYHDHGFNPDVTNGQGLNVHWTSITGYFEIDTEATSDKDPKRTGTRKICGTARTNLPSPDDNVNFVVIARDGGEPGVNDTFDIYLRNQLTHTLVYDTLFECGPHYLGSYAPCSPGDGGGGNIQLHKPNPSTTGDFGGFCDN